MSSLVSWPVLLLSLTVGEREGGGGGHSMIGYTDMTAVLPQRNLAHLRTMLRDIWAERVSCKVLLGSVFFFFSLVCYDSFTLRGNIIHGQQCGQSTKLVSSGKLDIVSFFAVTDHQHLITSFTLLWFSTNKIQWVL